MFVGRLLRYGLLTLSMARSSLEGIATFLLVLSLSVLVVIEASVEM